MEITVNNQKRTYITFDDQRHAQTAKSEIEKMIINQERNRHGPIWERGIRITWSRTTKWASEKERLTRGAHQNVTRRYILKTSKHGRRNSLLI